MFLAQVTDAAKETAKRAADKTREINFDDTWVAKFEELVPQKEIRWIICAAGFLMLMTVAVWAVLKIKGYSEYSAGGVNHLSEFEDLHDRGAFSEEEMARLKESIRSNLNTDPTDTTETDSQSPEQPPENKETEQKFEIKKPR